MRETNIHTYSNEGMNRWMKNKYESLFQMPRLLSLLVSFLETRGNGKCKGCAVWWGGNSPGLKTGRPALCSSWGGQDWAAELESQKHWACTHSHHLPLSACPCLTLSITQVCLVLLKMNSIWPILCKSYLLTLNTDAASSLPFPVTPTYMIFPSRNYKSSYYGIDILITT